MELRYDPGYVRHRKRMDPVTILPLDTDSLRPEALPGLAERLAGMIARHPFQEVSHE